MASLPFPTSKLVTSRQLTYNYVHVTPKPGNEGKYILFLHGFPSSAYDWHHQIEYFSQKGYGIIAPDCLGYGGTSKPLDLNLYKGKDMASDIIEILDHEKISHVIGVGHDWGSFLLSRLANYYPSRFTKYAFIDVGYSAPGHSLDVPTIKFINASVQKAMGYSVFGYFLFMNDDDAAELLDNNLESTLSLFHNIDEDLGKKYMGAEGGFRTWLTEGKVADKPAYLSAEDMSHHLEEFSAKNGGYGPSINWYKASLQNIDAADEKEIPEQNQKLTHPTLLLTGNNFIAVSAQFPEQMKAFAADLTVKDLQANHWIQCEKPQETNEALEEFFRR